MIGPEELDDLVKASLGLRWATIGPFESRTLGGGPGGMRHLIEHVAAQMTFDLGTADPEAMGPVCDAVEAAYGTGKENWERRSQARDRRTRRVLDALESVDRED